jgi:predicted CopG family antitoxin
MVYKSVKLSEDVYERAKKYQEERELRSISGVFRRALDCLEKSEQK